MATNRSNDPRLHIVNDEASRVSDRNARQYNVTAARAIAGAVESTLGPGGLDKMLSDGTGDFVVTNDGEKVLKSMEVANPTGRLLINIATAQSESVGDGTTSAMVLGGALLDNAAALIEDGVHPQSVIEGYERGRTAALDRLDEIGRSVKLDDVDTLRSVAETALTGNFDDDDRSRLADILVSAVQRTATEGVVDLDRIDIEVDVGCPVADSELFEGMIYDRKRLHSGMPGELSEASILMIKGDATLEPDIPGDERNTSFQVQTPTDLETVHTMEDEQRDEKIGRIIDSGVDCVFCEKGIDDGSQNRLADAGILAIRRVDPSDLRFLRDVVGGTVLTQVEEIDEAHLGCGSIERDDDGERLFISGEANSATTLFARAPTEAMADELERGIDNALRSLERTIIDGTVVPGGGATEIDLTRYLRGTRGEVEGRAQLAVEAAADAVERLPKALIENAGGDPIGVTADLRAEHKKGEYTAGWDTKSSSVVNADEVGIVEPVSIKRQAFNSAVEAATLVLRIDDIISASDLERVPDDED